MEDIIKKKVYSFDIVEELRRTINIEAENEEMARSMIEEKYQAGDIILNADDFTEYEIYSKGEIKLNVVDRHKKHSR